MNIQIGSKTIGDGHPPFRVAEIGINHNGDLEIAKKLIDLAVANRFDAVKFQKRTVDMVYSEEERRRPRESPFGTTNGELKHGLEFGAWEYQEINRYCREKGILWFASPWDRSSLNFLESFNPPCFKVASACLTDKEILGSLEEIGRPVILSTGMSTLEEIDRAVEQLSSIPLVILHTTSTYPASDAELNLSVIETLRTRYGRPVGYSGHEVGIAPTLMAVVGYGACLIERHITLSRAMWGTDQAASLEPRGLEILTRYLDQWEVVRGDGIKRVYDSELPVLKKLRRCV